MIEPILQLAVTRWRDWFDEAPPPLKAALIAGGPAHRDRGFVLLFSEQGSWPLVIAKVAIGAREPTFVAQEFEALAQVWRKVPEALRRTLPRPLGLEHHQGTTIFFLEAMRGRRLLVPRLTGPGWWFARRLIDRFLGQSIGWSRALADATKTGEQGGEETELVDIGERFLARCLLDGRGASNIQSFLRALGQHRIRWVHTWQHRDLMPSNVLEWRNELRFLDWEHARGDSQPWFDLAYAPGALVVVGRWQSGWELRDVAEAQLTETSWVGDILRRRLSEAWDHSLPLPWAVAVTSMETALRQQEEARAGWEQWSQFATLLLNDQALRDRLAWLAPSW